MLQQFPQLPDSTQCTLLDRLDDILNKCPHNSLLLTDHLVSGPLNGSLRASRQALARLRAPSGESPPDWDLLQTVIHLSLKGAGKPSGKRLVELLRKLSQGKRFAKCHLEYMYQYLKVKGASLTLKAQGDKALAKVQTALKMLQVMFEQRFEPGPASFFYFSGHLSGIQVNTKTLPQGEFQKVSPFSG